jgi:hypothetical protein
VSDTGLHLLCHLLQITACEDDAACAACNEGSADISFESLISSCNATSNEAYLRRLYNDICLTAGSLASKELKSLAGAFKTDCIATPAPTPVPTTAGTPAPTPKPTLATNGTSGSSSASSFGTAALSALAATGALLLL